LLADIEPDLAAVSKPGDANGWYRVLCDAHSTAEIMPIETTVEGNEIPKYRDGWYLHEKTIISREDLKRFAKARQLKPPFLHDPA